MSLLLRSLLIFGAVILAGDCLAHPDLLAQIEILDQRLAQDPEDVELLLQRGDLYRRHEDYASADRDFKAARKVEPDHQMLDFYQGRLLFETGHSEAAGIPLERYLNSRPDHAKAWILMGKINLSLSEFTQAADDFGQAITHSQAASPDLYRLKTWSEVAAGRDYWPTALATVDIGLQHFITEISLLGAGTDISLAAGKPETAKRYLSAIPPGLLRLAQWANRAGLLVCLETGDPAQQEECQVQSIQKVKDQVSLFIQE
jgi:tetratricopeptide (TPR) repeat protein